MGSNFIVGLDIGTATVRVVIAEKVNGKPALRAVIKEPSAGLRKGAIVDLTDISPIVARLLGDTKKVSKKGLKSTFVNIGTPQVKIQPSRGIVAVSRADSEIYEDDIERAIKASQALHLPPNRMIVHNVTREYIVDGVGDIVDPLGLSGNRLEVHSLIIDAFSPHVKNLMRTVELAGARIGAIVFDPLVASQAALSKRLKDLGVVLIDIGAGTTSLSVYEENKLLHVAIFPVGAGHITNDIAVGLKIPVDAAEAIKVGYGYAIAKEISPKETIDLKKFSPDIEGVVSRRFVDEIIESRLAEIFEFVNNELRVLGKNGQLAGGAVLVGGGAKLAGITALAKQELKLSAQLGFASREEWIIEGDGFDEAFEDPEMVNVLGLVLWGAEREEWKGERSRSSGGWKQLWKYFVP